MRKIIIDEQKDNVIMGVIKEDADPFYKTFEGTLENALPGIPQLLADAEAKWATNPKNPKYVAPPEPKKEKAPAKAKGKGKEEKPAETKTAGDLPLLAETGTRAPETEPESPPAEPEKKIEEKASPAAATAAAAPPVGHVAAAEPTGQRQYKLQDGRGPYNTLQEAMDAMGLDKNTRPQHNRWDRLSQELKKQILPFVKKE